MSISRRRSAKTCGGFNVTATSQIAVADNPSRVELTITNNSANDVSLAVRTANGLNSSDTPTAVVNDGIVLKANGGSWTTDAYTGPVAVIAGVAGPSRIAITEF